MTTQLERIRSALIRVTGEPKNGRFRCPYHGGTDYNLAIRDSEKKVQITCFSHKCDGVDILETCGLNFNRPNQTKLGVSLKQLGVTKLNHATRKYLMPKIRNATVFIS